MNTLLALGYYNHLCLSCFKNKVTLTHECEWGVPTILWSYFFISVKKITIISAMENSKITGKWKGNIIQTANLRVGYDFLLRFLSPPSWCLYCKTALRFKLALCCHNYSKWKFKCLTLSRTSLSNRMITGLQPTIYINNDQVLWEWFTDSIFINCWIILQLFQQSVSGKR